MNSINWRRYTREELDRYFGERYYFKEMSSPQAINILEYIGAKFGIEYADLSARLLATEDQTFEIADSEVYAIL
jgi:hypothetical protein